jgi:ubiquinone/menaquinone biosynthesis C-methylase UbiE
MAGKEAPSKLVRGTHETREHYDSAGWREGDNLFDTEFFGVREDGPIRQGLHALRWQRIREHFGSERNLLEVGCGGNPEKELLPVCTRYTGCDFSSQGIQVARQRTSDWPVPVDLTVADACHLPFLNAHFNAVCCMHMIYHIVDPAAQAKAIAEMLRVLEPGGKLVIVAANPRPVLFPVKFARRIAANTPVLSSWLRRRFRSPVPYKPMSIGWMMHQFRSHEARCITYSLPSTEFNQRVTESKGLGRRLWQGLNRLDRRHPDLSARLGCYVTYLVTKRV